MDDTAHERRFQAGAVVLAAATGAAWLHLGAPEPEPAPRAPVAVAAREPLPPRGPTGVTVWDEDRAFAGVNLVLSAWAPEAWLLDMRGAEIARWAAAWPDDHRAATRWSSAVLADDGGLLVAFEGVGLVRLARDGEVVWHRPLRIHGAPRIDEGGGIVALARQPRNEEEISHLEPVVDDVIVALDADGTVARRISLFDAWRATPDQAWREGAGRGGALLDASGFDQRADGAIVVALRRLDRLAVIGPGGRVARAIAGPWDEPAAPRFLPDGGFLLRDADRALEVGPDLDVRWSLPLAGPGRFERLPNGDTLVVERDAGRAYEVAPDGATVWSWTTPEAGADDPNAPAPADLTRYPLARWGSP